MQNTITNFLMVNGTPRLRYYMNEMFFKYMNFEIDYRITTILLLNVGADIDTIREFEVLHDKYHEELRA